MYVTAFYNCNTCYELLVCCFTPLCCNVAGNHEEMQVKHLVKDKPSTNKVNVGKWFWSEEHQWPSWDAILKGPICFSDSWESFHVVCPNH